MKYVFVCIHLKTSSFSKSHLLKVNDDRRLQGSYGCSFLHKSCSITDANMNAPYKGEEEKLTFILSTKLICVIKGWVSPKSKVTP